MVTIAYYSKTVIPT